MVFRTFAPIPFREWRGVVCFFVFVERYGRTTQRVGRAGPRDFSALRADFRFLRTIPRHAERPDKRFAFEITRAVRNSLYSNYYYERYSRAAVSATRVEYSFHSPS